MDYLIIGAGPAGLQLGYLLARAGYDYLIVEGGTGPGTFFRRFPRHRRLISINKPHTGSTDPEFNLRNDWNSLLSDDSSMLFTRYSQRYFPAAEDMVRYLEDFATNFELRVEYGTRITRITRSTRSTGNGDFRAADSRGRIHEARRLIVATGVSLPYIPDIPGIEIAEFYGTVSVDPSDFVDQRVLIIGKGNSAFETADNLVETAAVIHVAGPSAIRMAWRSHYVGHLRAVNNNLLDTYQLKSQNALLDGNVLAIERRDGSYYVTVSFSRANEIQKNYRYDRVIVCTGFRFDASIFADECRPELVHKARFPALTSAWESTNVGDLYFAGTLMQVRDFKKSTSGFVHGFRYAVRALHHVLEARYHGIPWPFERIAAEPGALMQAVIGRVNRTSALWQLFGCMGDLIIVTGDGDARYFEEVPVDYVHESDFGSAESYFLVTLEYGADHDAHDPFDISVGRIMQSDSEHAHQGRYLHPVVRYYEKRTLLGEHHVAENLENDWTAAAAHCQPLQAFFASQLRSDASGAALAG